MPETEAALATLIGSRICHDLISPIGAINNGLELLTMSGDPSGPEMGLIGESVGNASARIRFFRIAFGAAGDQLVGPGEVNSILRDLYDGSRLKINWQVNDPVQRTEVRMAFLALMCIETALPYGGSVDLRKPDDTWLLHGVADRVTTEASVWHLLAGAAMNKDLPPSHVQFALLPIVARDDGRKITVQSDETRLTIQF
jgi:histidine phosphotransferase ChpT